MKINIIVPFKRLAGGIKVIFTYANDLVDKGHDVVVYMPMVSYRRVKGQNLFQWFKASVSNTIKPERWIEYKFRFIKVPLVRERFVRDADVTVATAWPTAYDVARLSDKKGKKAYFVQGYEIFSGETEVVDRSYRLGLHTMAITRQLAALLKEKFDVDATVVYNGLDEDEFIQGDKPAREEPSVMLLYHEEAYKGTKEALAIAQRLREKHPDLRVNVFGRRIGHELPPYATALENPAREALMQMYRGSDIYLFTSTQEGWGLPILEAMANKCAVVGFRLGAMAEIADGENACVVDIGDTDAVYAAACALLDDRARLAAMQQRAYDTALQFTWGKSFHTFEQYLLALCDGE